MEGIDMTKKLEDCIKCANLLLEIKKLDVEVIQSLVCTLIDIIAKNMDVPSDINEEWGTI